MTLPYYLYQVSIRLANAVDRDQQTHFHPLFVGKPCWGEVHDALCLEIKILHQLDNSEATVRKDALKAVFEFLLVAKNKHTPLEIEAGPPVAVTVAGITIGWYTLQRVPAYLTTDTQMSFDGNDSSQPEA